MSNRRQQDNYQQLSRHYNNNSRPWGDRYRHYQPKMAHAPVSHNNNNNSQYQEEKEEATVRQTIDLLWDVQQNQVRQLQFRFMSRESNPDQYEETEREIATHSQRIDQHARKIRLAWLVNRHFKGPFDVESTGKMGAWLASMEHLVLKTKQDRR